MRFVADVMLGRLARLMRFHGYDVEYDNRATDEDLAKRSRYRLLLTRDRPLAAKIAAHRVYLVKAVGSEIQLDEIRGRFPLPRAGASGPVRCLICNAKLRPIAKRKVAHLVPPFIHQRYSRFFLCPLCRRIYWQGTHYEGMKRMIK